MEGMYFPGGVKNSNLSSTRHYKRAEYWCQVKSWYLPAYDSPVTKKSFSCKSSKTMKNCLKASYKSFATCSWLVAYPLSLSVKLKEI